MPYTRSIVWAIACVCWLVTAGTWPGEATGSEADDLWASALLLSATSTDPDMPRWQVNRAFALALREAKDKAPIFVSLGDYWSGMGPLAQNVADMVGDVRKDVNEKTARQLEAPAGSSQPSQGDAEARAQALVESMSAAVRESLEKHGQGLAESISGLKSQALRYYLAAAAEDPSCIRAWYCIAANEQAPDALRSQARQRMKSAQPDNSLPYYLEGITLCERGEPAKALEAVQAGNRKVFSVPQPPVPTEFRLRFPDTKSYREEGMTGKPVTPATLRYLVEANDTFATTPQLGRFRGLAKQVLAEGNRLAASADTARAVQCFEAVAMLGVNLVRNRQPDSLFVMTGIAITNLAAAELQPIYKAGGQDRKICIDRTDR